MTSDQDNQTIFECCCCFDSDVELNQAIACPDNHITCSECLQRALGVAVGQKTVIKCFHASGCNKEYTDVALNRALPDSKLKKAYDIMIASKAIREAQIDNTHSCPFCDNTVIIPDTLENFTTFKCNICDKYSCTKCNKASHEGPCDLRLRREEEATQRLILKCVCNAPLIRGDGCNHLICSNCRAHWCWICKQHLTGPRPYYHFRGYGTSQEQEKCPLYGERPRNQQFTERPPTLTSKRKLMHSDIAPVQVTLGEPCIPPPAPIATPVKRRRVPKVVCKATVKRTKEACTYKAKNQGYCGFHQSLVK